MTVFYLDLGTLLTGLTHLWDTVEGDGAGLGEGCAHPAHHGPRPGGVVRTRSEHHLRLLLRPLQLLPHGLTDAQPATPTYLLDSTEPILPVVVSLAAVGPPDVPGLDAEEADLTGEVGGGPPLA